MRKFLKRYEWETKMNLAALAGLLLYMSIGIAVVGAQDAPKNAPAATPTPALSGTVTGSGYTPSDAALSTKGATSTATVDDKKPKPVILERPQLLELQNIELRLENARLKAEAAIPQAVKDEMKAIGTELDKFWAERGIKREELATKWRVDPGVNGAAILSPVVPEEKKAVETPAPKK